MLSIHSLPKIIKKARRQGRGIAAGQGKTAGRGTKGQRSRTGKTRRLGFEGGQTPLQARVAKKRGFRKITHKKQLVITQAILAGVPKTGGRINYATLAKLGLFPKRSHRITFKILGNK